MASDSVQPGSPHVLVMFCDQLRLDLLGCYGGRLVRTPNIDQLARESVVFDHCYTPTALCSPARASLMTGLYAHRHYVFNNAAGGSQQPGYSYCEHLRPDVPMLQDWVADETNYESAYFGKWHIGPAEDLFSSRFHHTQPRPYPGGPRFLSSSHWHPTPMLGPLVKSVAGGHAGTLDLAVEAFPDVVAARYCQKFLRDRSDTRHFLLYCAFPGPHSPWMVPDEFGLRYDPRDIPIWPNRHDRFDGKPINQKKLRLLQNLDAGHARQDSQLQELLSCCFSYLELIDTMVGQVVATLKELNLYESTAIFFTADHGDMAGSHGFLSKGSYMYDEIYRVPLLFKPAGAVQAKRIPAPVHLMDITATVMHLVTGSPHATIGGRQLHGQSLLPLIEDSTAWPRTVHYAEYHGDWYGHYSSRMVTDGHWKLVWNLSDLGELYDLDDDPYELRNRFYDAGCRATRDRYFEILVEEAKRLGDRQVAFSSPDVEQELGECLNGPLRLTEA